METMQVMKNLLEHIYGADGMLVLQINSKLGNEKFQALRFLSKKLRWEAQTEEQHSKRNSHLHFIIIIILIRTTLLHTENTVS